MKHRKASSGIFVDVAVLIVCLAIATSCLASGMFAKFVSKGGGNDMARVASFIVNATMEKGNSGEGTQIRSYTINLTNKSETAVRYTVELTFTDNVKGIVSAKLGEKEGTLSEDGKTFTWTDGILPANTPSTNVLLMLNIDDPTAGGTYDFNVNVSFEQVN